MVVINLPCPAFLLRRPAILPIFLILTILSMHYDAIKEAMFIVALSV